MKQDVTLPKNEFASFTRYISYSPYKMRLVANLVKRRRFQEAVAILDHVTHGGAGVIRKILQSVASVAASTNHNIDEDILYVKNILVDEGPRRKKIWRRGRGRADLLQKRFCHVKVVVGVMKE